MQTILPLSAAAIRALLSPAARDFYRIEVRDSIPSTNTALKETASTAPTGTVLIAETQSDGRGRMGRTFHSPAASGVYMSILTKSNLPLPHIPYLTAATAAVCADAIDRFRGQEYAPTQIKWVNDIYVTDKGTPKKAAGILCESAVCSDKNRLVWAVIGIGINVTPPKGGFPPALADIAGALLPSHTEKPVDRNILIAMILESLYTAVKDPTAPSLCESYRARSLLDGKRILVRPASSLGGEEIPAIALYIDATLGLRVRYDDGKEETLSSGEVDFCGVTHRPSVHLVTE